MIWAYFELVADVDDESILHSFHINPVAAAAAVGVVNLKARDVTLQQNSDAPWVWMLT